MNLASCFPIKPAKRGGVPEFQRSSGAFSEWYGASPQCALVLEQQQTLLMSGNDRRTTHGGTDLEPVPHRPRQGRVRGIRLWRPRRLRKPAGADHHRCELGVLRRQAGADSPIDQEMAKFEWRGRLDRPALYPLADR